MKCDTETDHFEDGLKFLGLEARHFVLDSLACVFHNEGYSLNGNNEHSDVRWLADEISREMGTHTRFDRMSEDEQKEWEKHAHAALKSLPKLVDRIAHRYIGISKALRTMERVRTRQEYEDKTTKMRNKINSEAQGGPFGS